MNLGTLRPGKLQVHQCLPSHHHHGSSRAHRAEAELQGDGRCRAVLCADYTPSLRVITPFVLITSAGRLLQNLTALRPSHLTGATQNNIWTHKGKTPTTHTVGTNKKEKWQINGLGYDTFC